MSASGTLDLANYTTVWNDNFANDTSLNTSLFPVAWGNSDDFSFGNGGLTLTSSASEGWSAAGFMQADTSASDGQGYGLYSATFSADAGQGLGICIVMWPANNVWPGAEIDLAEDWSNTDRQSGNATIHWAGAGNSNQSQTYGFNANMTQPTTVAMDWEPGSLTFYVNGQEVFQYTGANVPADAANGGVNESFGAEVTAAGSAPVSSSVSLNLSDMSYSAYTPGAGSGSTASTPSGSTGTTTDTSTSTATSTSTTGTSSTTGASTSPAPSAVAYVTPGPNAFFATVNDQTVASGVANQIVVLTGQGDSLILGAAGNSVLADNSGMTFYNEGQSTNYLYDLVGGNTFAPDPAAGTMVTWDNVLSDGDQFDLRYALSASGWDGNTADLSQYLTDSHGAWGMSLSVHPSGGAAAAPVLDIMGQNANIDLATFLQHAIV